MQHDGAMRVDDALGFTGCAGGVAHGDGVVLIKLCIDGSGVRLQQGFVVLVLRGNWTSAERDDYHTLELHLLGKLLKEGKQHVIDDEPPVLGMIGDIGKFVGMQAQVQRVDHAANYGNSEIRLQMRGMIPHQGGNSVAFLYSSLLQASSYWPRAAVEVGVGAAMDGVIRVAG